MNKLNKVTLTPATCGLDSRRWQRESGICQSGLYSEHARTTTP